MDVEAAEFQDWEMLHSNPNSGSESLIAAGNTNGLDEIGAETGGLIQVNYFSVDNQSRCVSSYTAADGSEKGSEESDNPSWIDPCSENHFTMKNSGEFWSDSGSERSKFEEFNEVGFEGIEETRTENGKNIWSDSKLGESSVEGEKKNEVIEEQKEQKRSGSIVWWKVPREFLKYCAFRFSPVWTFSIAAAFMGFVILGRRLYKMKKKAKALELKVTLADDKKKVSQFMTRAVRLNEAFSVVKRVPLIRPQLPAAGVTPWPVMSLR